MGWQYDGGDPSIILWTTAVQRWGLTWPEDAVIAELGCSETDWLERMHAQHPRVTLFGVEPVVQRSADGWLPLIGSAMDPDLFAPESLDAVVMLGALEHFGLGFYGDPIDPVGDSVTMQNVARWLKPGGWVYFDVPFNPTYRVTENRHFRIYNVAALLGRLLAPCVSPQWWPSRRFYTSHLPAIGQMIPEPTEEAVPYHYVAVVAEKACNEHKE